MKRRRVVYWILPLLVIVVIIVAGFTIALLPHLSKGVGIGPEVVQRTVSTVETQINPERLIASHLDALGGRELLAEAQSLQVEGRITDGKQTAAVQIIRKRPNLLMLSTEVGDGISERRFLNGETAWRIIEASDGRKIFPLSAEEAVALQATFRVLNPVADHAIEGRGLLRSVSDADYGNRVVHDLIMEYSNGSIAHCYLDKETLFLVGVRETRKVDGETFDLELFMSDFRMSSGLVRPHKIELRINGALHYRITANRMETNTGVVLSLFEVPSVIDTKSLP